MTPPASGPGASPPPPENRAPGQPGQPAPGQPGDQGPDPQEAIGPVADPQRKAAKKPSRPTPPTHGLPGGRVVTVASLAVIVAAVIEALQRERIGVWSTTTLLVVAVIAPIVTRPGDRSLPAMMPPLAFLTAVLVAGQALIPQNGTSWRTREAVMILQQLGSNAIWVIVATATAVIIGGIGHFIDRRIARRRAAESTSGSAASGPTGSLSPQPGPV